MPIRNLTISLAMNQAISTLLFNREPELMAVFSGAIGHTASFDITMLGPKY